MSPSFCHIFRLSQNLSAGRLPACEDFDPFSCFGILDLAPAKRPISSFKAESAVPQIGYFAEATSLAFLCEFFPIGKSDRLPAADDRVVDFVESFVIRWSIVQFELRSESDVEVPYRLDGVY